MTVCSFEAHQHFLHSWDLFWWLLLLNEQHKKAIHVIAIRNGISKNVWFPKIFRSMHVFNNDVLPCNCHPFPCVFLLMCFDVNYNEWNEIINKFQAHLCVFYIQYYNRQADRTILNLKHYKTLSILTARESFQEDGCTTIFLNAPCLTRRFKRIGKMLM